MLPLPADNPENPVFIGRTGDPTTPQPAGKRLAEPETAGSPAGSTLYFTLRLPAPFPAGTPFSPAPRLLSRDTLPPTRSLPTAPTQVAAEAAASPLPRLSGHPPSISGADRISAHTAESPRPNRPQPVQQRLAARLAVRPPAAPHIPPPPRRDFRRPHPPHIDAPTHATIPTPLSPRLPAPPL